MKIINAISFNSANFLMKHTNDNHEKRRIYYFGFQVLYGEIFKIIIIAFISLLLGIIVPELIILATFVSLRIFAGGYHMNTYGKCFYATLIIFLAAGAFIQYSPGIWSMEIILGLFIITSILAFYCVRKYAPRDTPNKPITDPDDISRFKRISTIHIVIWMLLMSILLYFKLNMPVIASCIGLSIELLSISPAGHRFFDWISL